MPTPSREPPPCTPAREAQRILHKLHGGLGQQVIGLELCEGGDDVALVLLCVEGSGVCVAVHTLAVLALDPGLPFGQLCVSSEGLGLPECGRGPTMCLAGMYMEWV